jgi:hypothetical protein
MKMEGILVVTGDYLGMIVNGRELDTRTTTLLPLCP